MLESIARFCFRKYRLVIALWVLAVIGFMATSASVSPQWLQNGSLPNTESAKAIKILEESSPEAAAQAGERQGKIVFQSETNILRHRNAISKYLDDILKDSKNTHVISVESPFEITNIGQISRDGKTAFATVAFSQDEEFTGVGQVVVERAEELRKEITVEFSGQVFATFEFPNSELIGIIAAIFILLVAFGSVVAAGLPILTALMGVGIGTAAVALWSHVFSIPEVTVNVAAMIGIGVGIDYALFIVTRYRVEYAKTKDRELSTLKAMTTAGSAVLFAGLTVVISLLGMLIIALDFTNGLAIGASTAVLVMIIASLTLVPALLGSTLGKNLDRISIRRKKDVEDSPQFWVKWAGFIQKHSWLVMIVTTAFLVVLTLPLFGIRTGVADEGNGTQAQTTKRSYDILAEAFGPGFNGPLAIVVDAPVGHEPKDVVELVRNIEDTPGVAQVYPTSRLLSLQSQSLGSTAINVLNNRTDLNEEQLANLERLRQALEEPAEAKVIAIQVFPETSPQSEETANLVKDLRKNVIPQTTKDSKIDVYVSGITAANIDFANILKERIPFFIISVLLLSFILLLSVFRSVPVAIKAVILNLLSIGAAYGAVVAIFQWGWLRHLFGVGAPGPIEPWAPMLLFAIVFGLSMDYEVFLLSKIREEYVRTKDNARSVSYGLASTARVITAAALIMICVFGSFVLADDRILKLMGLGLAISILVDATIVRLLLVPATMEILGDKNWWFPKWLDKIVPQIHIEGKDEEVQESKTKDSLEENNKESETSA